MYFSMEYKFEVRCFSAIREPVEQELFRSNKHFSVIMVAIIKNIGNSRCLILMSMLMPQNLIFAKAFPLLLCLPHFLCPYCVSHRITEWLGTEQVPWVTTFLLRHE